MKKDKINDILAKLPSINLAQALLSVNGNNNLLLKLMVEFHQDYQTIGDDIINAFNNLERADMLNAMYKYQKLRALWKLADSSYTDGTPLW